MRGTKCTALASAFHRAGRLDDRIARVIPLTAVLQWNSASVALVSHLIPPGLTGYQLILQQLLGAIPEDQIATVGMGGPWGRRPRPPFPIMWNPAKYLRSLLTASTVVAAEMAASVVLKKMLPNVRRIFATLDPTIGVAATWARDPSIELWVYAIDLHAEAYWSAGQFMRQRLFALRDEAFRRATRVFALSEGMTDWLRGIGVTRPIELLPPLFPVGEFTPPPPGRLSFLMSGGVYSVNARPLRWIERAVGDLAPEAELRMITPSDTRALVAAGLNPARWNRSTVAPEAVPAEVAKASWAVVGVDSGESIDFFKVAWPTKFREYLGVGRPILCVSRPEYSVARMAAREPWGLFASTEEETRAAVARIVGESRAELESRARAAYHFAQNTIDDNKIGATLRRELCA